MKALLFGFMEWSITDERTGEVKEGINLNYVSPSVYYENIIGVTGLMPAKCKISQDFVKQHKLKNFDFPVSADLKFETTVTPKGKGVAVLTDITDVKPIKLFD